MLGEEALLQAALQIGGFTDSTSGFIAAAAVISPFVGWLTKLTLDNRRRLDKVEVYLKLILATQGIKVDVDVVDDLVNKRKELDQQLVDAIRKNGGKG